MSGAICKARRVDRTTPNEHLAVLERRLAHLRARAREHRRGEEYDRAEALALEWLLDVGRAVAEGDI